MKELRPLVTTQEKSVTEKPFNEQLVIWETPAKL